MLRPNTINGFTFYVRGISNGPEYVAREDATGIEKSSRIANAQGGYFEIITYGRYVMIASDGTQGKHGQDDLVMAVFDMQAKDFVSFAVAERLLYHTVSGPANPKWLWIKNGGSQPATYPGDPGTNLRRYGFISPTELEWVTAEQDTQGLDKTYRRWRRKFDPVTGALQPIESIAPDFTVNPANPQPEPEWF